jgi:leucyl aminopeptidase
LEGHIESHIESHIEIITSSSHYMPHVSFLDIRHWGRFMDFLVKSGQLDTLRTDCLIVQIYGDKSLSSAAAAIDKKFSLISRLLQLNDLTLKPGSCNWLLPPADAPFKRLLVVCAGAKSGSLTSQEIKTSAQAVAKAIKGKPVKNAVWSAETGSEVSAKLFATLVAEAFVTALYTYRETKTQNVKAPALAKLTLHTSGKSESAWRAGLELGQHLGEGINLARHLGDLPGNICTPTYLATQAKKLAGGKLSVTVLEEKQIKRLGMGAFLSVAAGSEQPAKFIVLQYRGAAAATPPTVLVGKGITFDTGGISIKPGPAMDEMKFDMCGAASVLGVMKTLQLAQPRINVVGLIAATENMPSGRATKPGDVVTSMSGQTIEILNTDAEGRLVLCDALTYAERFKPKAVIDIATLTGACVIALGNHASGLYANDQALADELLAAGQAAQDRAWQMPLWDDYQKALDSNFADMANVGGREGGSITAACFLSRYTKAYKWAHLDIAGTAWLGGGNKGATGRPVGLLLQYLLGAYSG